jgi:hypothetical protein
MNDIHTYAEMCACAQQNSAVILLGSASGRGRGAQGHRPLVTHALLSLYFPRRCRAAWVDNHSLDHSLTGSAFVGRKRCIGVYVEAHTV